MLKVFHRCARLVACALLTVAVVAAAGCDKAQLLAPTKSTITLSAPTLFLPSGGSTEVTAFVIEEAGTPVQNGTTVRFSANLGRVDPVEAQTRNGFAITTFFAPNSSGIATITASSGGATAGEGGTNAVKITIGAAAVDKVTLRANPANVGSSGGTVELLATVVGKDGQGLEGVAVTFSADQGTLSDAVVTTNASGEARTQLTTSQKTVVKATAGTTTTEPVTIDLRPAPIVTISCKPPGATTGNCVALQASAFGNTATVEFSVTRANGSSALRTATLDFGDGTSPQSLGTLAGTAPVTVTVIHTYEGPSGSSARVYTATVQATDVNGESTAASTTVTILPRAQLSVTLTATPSTAVAGVGQKVDFEATVTPSTGGADMVQKYEWDFGDGSTAETNGNKTPHVYTSNGRKTATVKVTTTDGRTATARTEFIISGV